MKKKSLLVVVSAACISVMLVACTGDVSAEVEPAEEQEIVIAEVEPEAGAEEVIEAEVEPEVEEEVPEEPEVDPNVELSEKYFAVSEEWARNYGGLYLERDGQLYSVVDEVPEQNYYDTGIGFRNSKDNSGGISLWGDDDRDSHVFHDLNVPFPCYEEGDKAILFTNEDYCPESLTFIPVVNKGYTISAYEYQQDGFSLCVLKDWNDMNNGRIWINEYQLLGSEGNAVNDIRDLDKEAEYKIEYDGGQELALTANCQYYEQNKTGAIIITGEDQGDDSFIYDLSELPSGDYFVAESYGLITIK